MPRKQSVFLPKYWTQSCNFASPSDELVLPKNVANPAFYISKEIAIIFVPLVRVVFAVLLDETRSFLVLRKARRRSIALLKITPETTPRRAVCSASSRYFFSQVRINSGISRNKILLFFFWPLLFASV